MKTTNFKGLLMGVLVALLVGLVSASVIAGAGIEPTTIAQVVPVNGSPSVSQPAGGRSFRAGSPHVIPAAAFVADGANPDSFFFPFGSGYFRGDSQNYGCMVAPVYLPDGVMVTDVFASVYDDDPNRGISLALRRVDNFNGGTDTMAALSTTAPDAFAGVQVISDISVEESEITHPDYSYYLTTCLGSSDIRLFSVRLYYTGDIYLPAVINK